jgi:hypothetical protein
VITILAIVGETLDLQTGEESSKGLLLSNGTSTRVAPAGDEIIKVVVELFAQAMATPEDSTTAKETSPSPRKAKKDTRPAAPGPVEPETGVGSI